MKIQIRSFVKGGNHGQYLQALGLAEVLKSSFQNAEVSHLNYENHFWGELKVQLFAFFLPKFLAMRFFWRRNLSFSSIGDQPDIVVYGSDMIWHLDSELFPADKLFFGEGVSAIKVAYAPSAGYRIPDEPEWLASYLSEFDSIGVRDNNTREMAAHHGRGDAELVVDPCFHLLNSRFCEVMKQKVRHDFVSVYSPMTHRLVGKLKQNMDLRDLPSWASEVKYLGYFARHRLFHDLSKQLTDPIWTLEQIASSQFLVTSTFHGVMMALMTETPFICTSSPNLLARLDSPVSECFSSNRIMDESELESLGVEDLLRFADFSDFRRDLLADYIQGSRDWLIASIEKASRGFN